MAHITNPDDLLFDPDATELRPGSLINGRITEGSGEAYNVIRPSDGEMVATDRSAGADDVDQALRIARAAHASGEWSNASARQKSGVFRRWAELVEARSAELVGLEAAVSTRLGGEVVERDVPISAAIIRYYGELVDKIEGQVYTSAPEDWSIGVREPYGVIAAISPWNSPITIATAKIAPALAAGNAVVLKPSEFTPYAVRRIAELGVEAGIPAGNVGILLGSGPETGSALVRHEEVDCVSFTGSTVTGRQVMTDAAQSGPKPVSLEMGGKGPQVVFADADLQATAEIVAASIVRNAGQICYAGTRLIVHRTIADALTDRVGQLIAQAVAGPTWSRKTTLSPIMSRKQLDRVCHIVDESRAAGAEIITGGKVLEAFERGFYYEPTIVTRLTTDNPVVQQEVFGPVLAVQGFDDEEEAIALADHPDYGLGASVYTSDLGVAMRCAKAIKAGTVWVNRFGVSDITTPVGGYKKSGFGKDFGIEGMLKYMHVKNISVSPPLGR